MQSTSTSLLRVMPGFGNLLREAIGFGGFVYLHRGLPENRLLDGLSIATRVTNPAKAASLEEYIESYGESIEDLATTSSFM